MHRLILTLSCLATLCARTALAAESDLLAGCSSAPELARPGYSFIAEHPDFPEFSSSRIGQVYLTRLPIFNEDNPRENNTVFRWANRFHVLTREGTVSQLLLFDSGENYDLRVLDETERLLRNESYYHDVDIRPVRSCNGEVDVEVITKDTWSLTPGFSYDRSGGENTHSFSLRDTNLLGLGKTLSIADKKDTERNSTELVYRDNNVLGTRIRNRTSYIHSDDGSTRLFELALPFYELDSRRAWKVFVENGQRIDAQYFRGKEVTEVRHDVDDYRLEMGVSAGLRNGRSQRWSFGVARRQNRFTLAPDLPPPTVFPENRRLVFPFVAYEMIEDDYVTVYNFDQIYRTEDIHLGGRLQWQFGYAAEAFGSDLDRITLRGSWSDTLRYNERRLWQYSLNWQAYWNLDREEAEEVQVSFESRYFRRWNESHSLFASVEAVYSQDLNSNQQITFGALHGARAFENRFQVGDRRWSFTVEHRYYTDLHILNLLRVGGAAFLDVGRAWEPGVASGMPDSVLADIGIGLRLASSKAASSRIGHLDFAFPLSNRDDPAVDNFQVAFTIKGSF